MEFLNQVLGYLQKGLDAVIGVVKQAWSFCIDQIQHLLSNHPTSIGEILLLVVAGGVIIYLLYAAVKHVLDASHKVLVAIGTLLGVVIQTVLPVVIAGLVAGGAAYVVNTYQF
jgi:hypothetical protein